MKKKIKQFLSALLMAVMFVGVIPFTASATQSRTNYFNKSYSYSSSPVDYIMNIAQAQIGRTQSQMGYTEAWCADFVGDCAKLAGQDNAIPLYGGCTGLITRVLDAGGQKVTNRQKGDLVFYYCSSCACYVHVGLVLDSTYSIEGNYNNKVTKVSGYYSDGKHNTSSGTIKKVYVRPKYIGGVHTHSYNTYLYYEAAHPHYNCYQCSCGDIKAVKNETNYVSSCSECNHTHSYVENYEAAHPHKQYMACSCGSYYYTGQTVYLENKDCCVKANSDWKFTDYNVPSISNLPYGSDFNIKGTVSSNVRINWVGVVLYDSIDKEIAQANAYPGSTSYNISDLNDQLDFSKLPVGKYKLLVHANNPNNDYTILYSEYFNVGAPTLAAPEVSIRTTSDGKAVFSWPAVTNANNYDIRIFDSNKESYKDVWSISETSYEIELPDGYYYVWVCSSNSNFYYCFTYGNMCGFTVKKTIPEKPKLKNLNSYYTENSKIKFEWDSTERTTHYSLYLKKLNESTNEYEVYDYEMHYVESGYERCLPAGKYAVQLQASNSEDWSYTDGDWVEFTVYSVYTVSYNMNGGTGSIANQTKIHDTNLTLTTTKPTGKNFTVTYNVNGGTVSTSSKMVSQAFTNWNTAANGSGTAYNAGATYSANASVTLYAQYANPSIGSLPTPTRSGYTFDGWYTAANGGTKITDSTKVTANMTIYAHWKANAYTVSYNVNGGTGSIASQTKMYGTDLTLTSSVPTRTGYTFVGWSESKSTVSAEYISGGKFSKNADTTLYAVWKINTYTVKYDLNGGTGSIASQTKTYGKDLTLTSAVPTKTGYTFVGWSESASAESAEYLSGGSFSKNANTVLYAVWKADAPKLAGDINGDGIVNGKDLTRLRKYLAGQDVQVNEDALDVNGDGVVNGKDLTRLLKYLAGQDVQIY